MSYLETLKQFKNELFGDSEAARPDTNKKRKKVYREKEKDMSALNFHGGLVSQFEDLTVRGGSRWSNWE